MSTGEGIDREEDRAYELGLETVLTMNLAEAASLLLVNAELSPDPRMNGTTDCYLVTLDDMDALRIALATAASDGEDNRTARELDESLETIVARFPFPLPRARK